MNSNMKSHWTRIPLLLTAALLASCLLTAWMAVHGFYINTYLAALLTLGIAWAVCRYMKRTSRLMEQFVQSVRYSEFPEAFGSNHAGGHRGLPPELLDSMQEALEHYRTNLQRKEGRLLYFQALANHIDTAVLVYTPQGGIEWKNEAATRLLASAVDEQLKDTWALKAPKTVDDLRLFHPDLPQLLRDLRPSSLHVIQVQRQEEGTQLALSGLKFILQGRKLIIASLKNIHSALDTQETLAWQKLIRVLTHEIMNSVTPIVSLAELLGKQVEGLEGNEQEKEDMRQMLATIARRGSALTRFVSSYREVSHLPPPLLQPLDATALLEDVLRFMQTGDNDLHLTPPPAPLRAPRPAPPPGRQRAGGAGAHQPDQERPRERSPLYHPLGRCHLHGPPLPPCDRRRYGHRARGTGTHLRSLLHHQTRRFGHRPHTGPPDYAPARRHHRRAFLSRRRECIYVAVSVQLLVVSTE